MYKSLLLLSLIPVAVMANPAEHDVKQCDDKHHHKMKHKRSGDMPFYLRGIELDETQKAQIKALMEKRHTDRKADKADYWKNKQAIQQLTQAENLNEAELEKLVDASLEMKKQKAMEKARFHHEVFNLLSPEQQEQLKIKMAEFKKKHAK